MTKYNSQQEILEKLLDQPFMQITAGDPDYDVEREDGPPGYSQEIISLQINNVREDVLQEFRRNYNTLADQLAIWARQQGFVSSQILDDEKSSLTFEITAISS